MRYLIPVICLLFAYPAWSEVDAWQQCGVTHEGGRDLGSPALRGGGFIGGPKSACYDTDGVADSPILNVASCDNIDIKAFNMTDGAFADLSVIPRACPSTATSTTTCNTIVADLATATNQEALGYATNFIFVDMVTNTNSDDVRVMVRCNGD